MVTVEVSAKLTVEDLLVAVEQLPTQELTDFVRRVIAIQSQRGVLLLNLDDEQALLAAVEDRLPAASQKRLDILRDKRGEGTLTAEEQAELLGFVQQIERQDLLRVQALVSLAHKRGKTVSELMDELGLEGSYA